MPYKSQKIVIAGTKNDRRIKLTEEDKELIKWLNEEEKISQRKLAIQFKVSKRLIQFVLNPQKLIDNKKKRAERGGSKIYYDKDYHTESIREHRQYKQKLFLENKISLPDEKSNRQTQPPNSNEMD